jgi:hypothetical protein
VKKLFVEGAKSGALRDALSDAVKPCVVHARQLEEVEHLEAQMEHTKSVLADAARVGAEYTVKILLKEEAKTVFMDAARVGETRQAKIAHGEPSEEETSLLSEGSANDIMETLVEDLPQLRSLTSAFGEEIHCEHQKVDARK